MGAVVTAEFLIGGVNNISRNDLNKITKVLGISDPNNKLPTGRNARYVLVLETTAPTPSKVPVTKSKKKRI